MLRVFKVLLSFLLMALPMIAIAQNQQPEMADALRRDGKIYIVVIVIFTIFIGLVIFLFTLDRRIRKIENQNQNN